jgi:hypothetical protein
MADAINLEFIAAQLRNVLDEQRAMRDEQRRLAETVAGLSREIEHIRDDLVITIKAEIGAFSRISRRGWSAGSPLKSTSACRSPS